MRRALPLLLLLTGCYEIYGDEAEHPLPLMGSAVPTSSLPRLNEGPLQYWEGVRDPSDQVWLLLCESISVSNLKPSVCEPGLLRVRRLREPADTKVLTADALYTSAYTDRAAIYALQYGRTNEPDTLSVYLVSRLGQAGATLAPAHSYKVPHGVPKLQPSPNYQVVMHRVARTSQLDLLWRDREQRQTLQLLDGDQFDDDPGFDSSGGYLLVRVRRQSDPPPADPRDFSQPNRLLVYRVGDPNYRQELGFRPRAVYASSLNGKPALLSCGAQDGLRLFLYGLTRDMTPEPQRELRLAEKELPKCEPGKLSIEDIGDGVRAVIDLGTELLRIPLNGSPPDRAPKVQRRRILARSGGLEVYSLDQSGLYGNNAGDGWIGSWRFMERGLFGYVTPDRRRVRFVEHAANALAVGELRSATLYQPASRLLARNVPWPYFFDLGADDTRALAIDNAAYPGPQNRLIAIDEERGYSQALVEGAHNFALSRVTNDLLIETMSNEIGFDLVRMPLPPRL